MRSDALNELATALAKAQGQIEDAIRDSENPFFKSRYADLASVWRACRRPLADNGLAVIQSVTSTAEGYSLEYSLETMLLHSSGQYVSNTINLLLKDQSMQGMGSAITYARRYQLAAFVGVAPDDDDDGNAASQKAQTKASAPAEHFCAEHKVAFQKHTKDDKTWYSHKQGDGWCNEDKKPLQESQGKPQTEGTPVDPKTIKFKNPGEFYAACHNILDMARSAVDPQITMYDISKPEQREKAWLYLVEQAPRPVSAAKDLGVEEESDIPF